MNEDERFESDLRDSTLDALRLARFLGHTLDDASDVVQDAAILAWRYRATRRGEWRPWFLAIVRRVARRRRERWTLVPSFWQADLGGGTDYVGDGDLQRALAELPRRRRAAVWLRYGRDLTYRDVARVLGVREAAARMLVARGRADLRAKLQSSSAVNA